jgi:hypothetical protein
VNGSDSDPPNSYNDPSSSNSSKNTEDHLAKSSNLEGRNNVTESLDLKKEDSTADNERNEMVKEWLLETETPSVKTCSSRYPHNNGPPLVNSYESSEKGIDSSEDSSEQGIDSSENSSEQGINSSEDISQEQGIEHVFGPGIIEVYT